MSSRIVEREEILEETNIDFIKQTAKSENLGLQK